MGLRQADKHGKTPLYCSMGLECNHRLNQLAAYIFAHDLLFQCNKWVARVDWLTMAIFSHANNVDFSNVLLVFPWGWSSYVSLVVYTNVASKTACYELNVSSVHHVSSMHNKATPCSIQ